MKNVLGIFLVRSFLILAVIGLAAPQLSAAEPVDDASADFVNPLSEELVAALNTQIKSELDGAHFYLAISNLFYRKGLDGFGHWYSQQYYEELNHARIMMDFLKRKNAELTLTAISAPAAFTSEEPAAIFEQSLKIEEDQSRKIQDIHERAVALNARDVAAFLQWFIDEQVQEEDLFQSILDRLRLVNNSAEGILLIDRELAARAAVVVWNPGQPLPAH